jgi:hypothetical protein
MSIKIEGFPPSTAGITGGLVYQGSLDPGSLPADITSAKKGAFYIVSADGTLAGVAVKINDHIVFNQDAASPLTSAMFDVIDNTESTASETVAGIIEIATNAEATTGTATNKALVPSNISSIGTSQLNNDAGFITSYTETDTLDDVVGRGSSTTNSITTGGLTVSGDIDPNTTDTYFIGSETNRFISYYGDVNGAIRFKAKNDSGGVLNKGEAVYIKGVSGTVPTVDKARSNSASTMAAFGLVYANANDQAEVQLITFGNLEGLDTSSFTAGDVVYVSSATAGALVSTPPTGESNFIQNIGKVLRSHASDGIIKVGGAGRTNATPNLNQDKVFLGNASNQAVATALSSINLSSFNNDSGFITDIAAASETVAGKIEIATNAEATAGTATDKALVPSNLSSIGTSQLNNDANFIDNTAASETVAGIIEIATNAEATAGTATDKALVPSNISSIDLNQLDEISYTAGAGIDGKFLKYVNANSQWEAADAPTAAAASETVAGVIEIATNAEATAGTATDKALVPSNLSSVGTSQLNNDAGFIDNTAASETVAGIIEIATNAEATTGTATDKALVPSNLSSIGTSQLNNDASFITDIAAASETVAGKIEIATNAEATAGTATDKALVPSNISSIDLNQLDEISYTAGASIDGKFLKYVNANSQWEAADAPSGGSALPPEVKETTTSTPVSVSLTPSDSNSYTDLEVMYLVNNSSTAVELDLPTASGNAGKKIHIKRNGTATVTIDPNGTEQIDNGGAGTAFTLTAQYQSVSLISNGANWFIF